LSREPAPTELDLDNEEKPMSTAIDAPARSSSLLAIVAVTALLTSFVGATYGFGFYLFSQLVPDMRADLGFDYSAVGTITAAAQGGFLAFAVLGAWLAPRVGGGRVVIGSVLLCGLCLLLVPRTPNIWAIAGLLTILGGTAASVYVPMVELTARVVPFQHRGKVLGLVSSGTSYGVFLNSLVVPAFLASGNWRGVWTLVGALTMAIAIAGAVTFRRLGLLQHESIRKPRRSDGVPTVDSDGWSGILVPWVFIVWSMTFLNGFSTLPFQNYLSPYLREELGFGVDFAARVWATIGLIGMVAGFVIGSLADRAGIRFALILSYVFVALAAIILIAMPIGVLPMVAGVLFALAFYPIFGLIPAYVSKITVGETVTKIFSVANVTLGVGGIVGNYAAGLLKDSTGSFVPIYAAIALAAAILTALSVMLPSESDAGARGGARPM
jgi:MFS family permease